MKKHLSISIASMPGLSAPLKTKFKCTIRAVCHSFGGVVCAGVVLLIASSTQAQNLFVSDYFVGNIYEFTPVGGQSPFASGLDGSSGLAFNSAGDLFESDEDSGYIYEFTPSGAQSTFASGLSFPQNLAFNSVGDLFVADAHSGNVYEFTPSGAQSTFASGVGYPQGLAFQGETLPVPEPSTLGLLAIGMFGITLLRRHQR